MTREVAAVAMLVLLAVLLVLMWRGWRNRVSRYADLPTLARGDSIDARPIAHYPLLYVATTEAEAPLERIARSPLAFRSAVTLGTGVEGVWLDIPGEHEVFIASGLLRGVGRATWTIDRVVDSDGLVFVRWLWGQRLVDSYFRSVDYPAETIVAALEAALPADTEEDA